MAGAASGCPGAAFPCTGRRSFRRLSGASGQTYSTRRLQDLLPGLLDDEITLDDGMFIGKGIQQVSFDEFQI